jgi:hypothetical protein
MVFSKLLTQLLAEARNDLLGGGGSASKQHRQLKVAIAG